MKLYFFRFTALLFLVGCFFSSFSQRVPMKVHVSPAEEDAQKTGLSYSLTCLETKEMAVVKDRGFAMMNLEKRDHVLVCLDGVCVVCGVGQFEEKEIVPNPDFTDPQRIQLYFFYPQYVQKVVEVSAYSGILKNIESPANVGIAKMNILSQGDHSSLQNVLNTIPGVTYESRGYGGSQRINIRGSMLRSTFGVRNVRVYYDGYTITSPDGTTPFEVIDPEWMESVEVYKGPIGYQFGNGTGGVIGYQSKKAIHGYHAFSYEMTLGSFGYSRFKLGAQFPIFQDGANQRQISIRMVDQSTDGYREQEGNNKRSVEIKYNKKIRQYWWKWRHSLIGKDLGSNGLLFQYHKGGWGLPGSIKPEDVINDPRQARPFAVANNTRLERERWMIGMSRDRNVGEHWKSTFRLSEQVALKTNPYGTNPSFQGFKDESSRSWNERYTLQYQKSTFDEKDERTHHFVFLLGEELQSERYSITERDLLNGQRGDEKYEYRIQYWQVFAWGGIQYQWKDRINADLGTSVHTTQLAVNGQYAGGSLENHDFSWKPATTPRMSASVRLWEQQYLYASRGWGFSNPNVFEQVDYVQKRFNSSLLPEWGRQDEWGWKGSTHGWEWTLCRYQQQMTRIILAQTPTETLGSFANAGATQLNGWEAMINKGFDFGAKKQWGLIQNVALHKTNYAFENYQDKGTDYSGNTLPGNALHTVNYNVQLKWKEQWNLYINDYWCDQMYLNNQNDVKTAPYHLMNVSLSKWWSIESKGAHRSYVGFTFGVNNLLNAQYSSFLQLNDAAGRFYNPAPVRNFYGSVYWSLSR
jgi:iron complex outermembrane recepter protein